MLCHAFPPLTDCGLPKTMPYVLGILQDSVSMCAINIDICSSLSSPLSTFSGPICHKTRTLFYFLFKSGALFSTICGTLFRGQSEITKSEYNFSSDSIWAFSLLIDSVQIHFVYCFFKKFGLDLTHSKVREAKTAISHHSGKHKPVKTW